MQLRGGGGGGATPRFGTPTTPPTNCWPEAPGGGGDWRGDGGGSRRGDRGGPGRVGWGGGGGVQVGRIGVVGGGGDPGGAIWGVGGGGAQAPLTSPCPPSNHTITINLPDPGCW